MDLAASQGLKRRLVRDCKIPPVNGPNGIEYLRLNLVEAKPFEELAKHPRFKQGPGVRTLYIQEHVAPYLQENENKRWLPELRKLSANPEDRLVFMALRSPAPQFKIKIN